MRYIPPEQKAKEMAAIRQGLEGVFWGGVALLSGIVAYAEVGHGAFGDVIAGVCGTIAVGGALLSASAVDEAFHPDLEPQVVPMHDQASQKL